MSVWLCIPSARPVVEVNARMDKWRALGYKIALWRDLRSESCQADWLVQDQDRYPGYYAATNELIEDVLDLDRSCDWVVCGGDDIDPDPSKTAEEIAEECSSHFSLCDHYGSYRGLFGVMQPTGDRWGDKQGPYIDRVAGSPWIGREFATRVYRGHGPFWPEYHHMGGDEELQAVAKRLGVFWQRPDLTHYHDHWGRPIPGERLGQKARMPKFLERANSPAEWKRYKEMFAARQAAGFPGSELV